MRIRHYNFNEVTRTIGLEYKCKLCGKRKRKMFRATNTINPFNKNEDGTVKTYDQVNADVVVSIEAEIKAFDRICPSCKEPNQ